jgi:tetratricopeptide (TPR) repeat protein
MHWYRPLNVSGKKILLLAAIVLVFVGCGPSLEKRKEESAIHYRMGAIHLNDRKFTDALEELTIAVDIYSKEPSYHNALGLAYFAKGMNQEAESRMKEAIRLNREFSEAHVNLSAVYLVEGEWDKAISESREALKNIFYRTPELAHFNIGWGYYNKGEYEEALENFKKAVELNPRYSRAYYDMGLTMEEMNRIKDSIVAYKEAIKVSPDYLDAHYSLGLALLKNKENRRALKAFEKVVEIAPESEQARSARDYIDLMR